MYLTTLEVLHYNAGSSNKLYVIMVVKESTSYSAVRAWGRCGTNKNGKVLPLTVRTAIYESAWEASVEYMKTRGEKIDEGYKVVPYENASVWNQIKEIHPVFKNDDPFIEDVSLKDLLPAKPRAKKVKIMGEIMVDGVTKETHKGKIIEQPVHDPFGFDFMELE